MVPARDVTTQLDQHVVFPKAKPRKLYATNLIRALTRTPKPRYRTPPLAYNLDSQRPRGGSVQRSLSAAIVAAAGLDVYPAADKRCSSGKPRKVKKEKPVSETGYLLDNAWQQARERLTLQEQFADKATHRKDSQQGSE